VPLALTRSSLPPASAVARRVASNVT